MPKVMNAIRTTSTDALQAISASAHVITKTIVSVSNYVDAMEAHSEHFAATTRASYKISTDEMNTIAREKARVRIVQARLDIEQEMQNPRFKELYNSFRFDDEKPSVSIAAE